MRTVFSITRRPHRAQKRVNNTLDAAIPNDLHTRLEQPRTLTLEQGAIKQAKAIYKKVVAFQTKPRNMP
ncbi:MAG: hypothetical protein IKE45_00690 [Halomonas sp.]|nr:hypothetical protein [Halomonas sp.]MBR2512535.1 hypothetical protein [Halomonas sp.]